MFGMLAEVLVQRVEEMFGLDSLRYMSKTTQELLDEYTKLSIEVQMQMHCAYFAAAKYRKLLRLRKALRKRGVMVD